LNRTAVLVCAVTQVVLIGCASSRDEPREKAFGKDAREAVVEKGDLKGDFSFAAGGKIALPDPFPGDVPLYPGAALRLSQELDDDDVTVVFGTPSPPSEVETFYRREMEAEGWRFMGDARVEGRNFLSYAKDMSAATIVTSPGDGETVISMAYKERPGK
jgi:hypothetical protein